MMLTYLFVALLVAFVLFMLIVCGSLSFNDQPRSDDTVAELRKMLVARSDGTIGQEEFERRQAALHQAVLNTPDQLDSSATRKFSTVLVVTLTVLIAGFVVLKSKQNMTDDRLNQFASPHPINLTGVPRDTPVTAGSAAANIAVDMNTAVSHLKAKLQEDPKNGEGWLLLARSYNELGRHQESVDAYANAIALLPADPQLILEKNSQERLAAQAK